MCYHRFNTKYQEPRDPQGGSNHFHQPQPRATLAENTAKNNSNMIAMLVVPKTLYEPSWYPNFGATNHFTPDSNNPVGKSIYNGDSQIKMASGEASSIQHYGNSYFFSPNSTNSLYLHNLLHVLTISKNLLSVSQVASDNHVFFEFQANTCSVKS